MMHARSAAALFSIALAGSLVACDDSDSREPRKCEQPCSYRDTDCLTWTCDDGTCVAASTAEGTACGLDAMTPCTGAGACDAVGSCVHEFVPDGTACGDDTQSDCDSADSCDGAGACVSNVTAQGVACGEASASLCDLADSCDGAGACSSNTLAVGAICGEESTDCTAFQCSAAGDCEASHVAADAPCGDTVDSDCSLSDRCDGAGICLSRHMTAGAMCGDQSIRQCDNSDRCDGLGSCSHAHVAMGTTCGDSTATECDAADVCDGEGDCSLNYVAQGTACGSADVASCDGADSCDGSGFCEEHNAREGSTCADCPAGENYCSGCFGGTCEDRTLVHATCAGATGVTPLLVGSYGGLARNWSAVLPGACTSALGFWGAPGAEGYTTVAVAPGEFLELAYVAEGLDAVPYFTDDCAQDSCFNAVDDTASGDVERLRHYNAGDSSQVLYTVFDHFGAVDPNAPWSLEITAASPTPLTPAATCAEAQSMQSVANGDYVIDLSAATNDVELASNGCVGFVTPGVDVFVPVTVEAGATLTVLADAVRGDPALYLLTTCGATPTCAVGSDFEAAVSEMLAYSNVGMASETLILAIDSTFDWTGTHLRLRLTSP